MPILYSETIQGSDEWLAERAGKVSASNFAKIFTTKGALTTGETRKKYLYQLAGERITGVPEETFKNFDMQRGNDLEPDARDAFERLSGEFVYQVGMIYLNERKLISCSPDGLVGDVQGLEIKCPKLSTHVGYLVDGKLPADYIQQVQGSLMVSGRDQWHFLSYHPAVKEFHILVERDEKYIALLREAVESFDAEVGLLVEQIMRRAA